MPGSTELLQQIHAARTELGETREQLANGPLQLKAAQAKLDRKAVALAALQEEAKNLRKAADGVELQIKTAEARMLDLRGKLNAANNVKEYDAIKDEIARLAATVDVFEGEGLEIMGRQDAKAADVAAAAADLATGKAEHAKLKTLIDYQMEKFRGRVADTEARLAGLVPQLEKDTAALYLRNAASKGEGGLAACAGGVCGHCCNQQPPQICGSLRMGAPEVCRSCGALLYWEA